MAFFCSRFWETSVQTTRDSRMRTPPSFESSASCPDEPSQTGPEPAGIRTLPSTFHWELHPCSWAVGGGDVPDTAAFRTFYWDFQNWNILTFFPLCLIYFKRHKATVGEGDVFKLRMSLGQQFPLGRPLDQAACSFLPVAQNVYLWCVFMYRAPRLQARRRRLCRRPGFSPGTGQQRSFSMSRTC